MDDIQATFKETSSKLSELHEQIQMLQVDTKLVGEASTDSSFREYAEKSVKALFEYSRRGRTLVERFEADEKSMIQFLKQMRVQIAMLSSQLKFQYDVISEPSIINTFTDNIKTISDLLNTASQRIGTHQNNLLIANELVSKVQNIMNDVSRRMEAMR